MAGVFGIVGGGDGAGFAHQVGEANDGVQRRTQLVAHGGEKGGFGARIEFRFMARAADGLFRLLAQIHLAESFGIPRKQTAFLALGARARQRHD
jgi:hypothetical protein